VLYGKGIRKEVWIVKILIVEDEKLLADSIGELLRGKGFEVEIVYDGEMGAQYAELGVYDLLILDVMMPGMDGYALTRQVRAKRLGTPILMLTARSGLEDRITGLNAGADYYLTKPFDIRELLACINALLRRQGAQVDEVRFGNTCLDLASATLLCGQASVRLSAKEFDIMRFLLQAGERNLSKKMILARVWGYDSDAVENHVEVYIGFLRKKLASIGSDIRIVAIRRLGYHLEVGGDD
jgi:DNA-binding response OmpR family regulator